jgi:hypothetical protein
MSRRRKQTSRRRGPRGQAEKGEVRLDLWPFAFQDLVDQGRVMWLPDIDVRATGDRLVVHVPHVGDVSIAAPARAPELALARRAATPSTNSHESGSKNSANEPSSGTAPPGPLSIPNSPNGNELPPAQPSGVADVKDVLSRPQQSPASR